MTQEKALAALGLTLFLLLTACSGEATPRNRPASVRGWIGDIELTGESYAAVTKVDEALRRMEMLGGANIYVENVKFASGGVEHDGSFLLLDIPPGNARIVFQIPGVADSVLTLENIPSKADVLIPNVKIAGGKATVVDPSKVKVRLPSKEPKPTNVSMIVSGHRVAAVEVTLKDLADRRDFPTPEGPKPIAIVH